MMKRLFAVLLACAFASGAAASEWTIDHGNSRLGFVGTQSGAKFTGEFKDFEAIMRFDPDALETALFDVTIDVTSFDSNSGDRDSTVAGKDWFWFKKFPKAKFVAKSFRRTGDNAYVADGELTIRNKTNPVALAFTWQIDDDTATMDGSADLLRSRFDVGTGEWASGKTVGLEVEVQVDLTLTR